MYERCVNSGSKAVWYRDSVKIESLAPPPEMKLMSSGLMGKKQLHLSLSASEWVVIVIWLLLFLAIIYFNSGVFCKYLLMLRLNSRPPLWSSGQSFWLQIQRSRVRFPALPDFLSSSGSGTGSTQPREVN